MSAVIALFPSPRHGQQRRHIVRSLHQSGYEMHIRRLASGRLIPEFRHTACAAAWRAMAAACEGL